MRIRLAALVLVISLFPVCYARAQDDEGYAAERQAAANFALKQLPNRDPLVRQRAAEVLAKFSVVEHRRLAEGYRLQEKNDRVRLALDWALYRMGKTDALYGVVRELRSDGRRPQAVGYLSQLVDPQPLYSFLDRADRKSLIGLFEVMAVIGDSNTFELIKPFSASDDPDVSDAAKFAQKEIAARLAKTSPGAATRPREVRAGGTTSP